MFLLLRRHNRQTNKSAVEAKKKTKNGKNQSICKRRNCGQTHDAIHHRPDLHVCKVQWKWKIIAATQRNDKLSSSGDVYTCITWILLTKRKKKRKTKNCHDIHLVSPGGCAAQSARFRTEKKLRKNEEEEETQCAAALWHDNCKLFIAQAFVRLSRAGWREVSLSMALCLLHDSLHIAHTFQSRFGERMSSHQPTETERHKYRFARERKIFATQNTHGRTLTVGEVSLA